jgi:hypothetical protein
MTVASRVCSRFSTSKRDLKLRPNASVQKCSARVNVRYCTVRENVVIWVTAPDVAVTVTVEVPVATGADGVDGVDDVVEALHPPSISIIASRGRIPPQIIRYFCLVFRFVHIGKRPANPRGNRALTLTI